MSKNPKTKNAEKMWQALEQTHQAPQEAEMVHLSNLTEEDADRLAKAWPQLPPEARRRIIERLAAMAEDDFELDFNGVFRLALRDPDAVVRATAIDSLWEDEDVRLIPDLIRFLQKDEAENVRSAAAQCLAHFVLLGEMQRIRPRPFEMVCQALLATYRAPQESLEVRRRALESLAYASLPEVINLITEAYALPDELMRISAVFAMGRSTDSQWNKTVIRELHSPNPAMRYEAVRACGELATRDALSEIIELVDDVDAEVQEAALWALGQIGGNRARKTLEHYADSENEALHLAAVDALNELDFLHGDLDEIFAPATNAFEDEDEGWEEALWDEEEEEENPAYE